MGVNVLGGTYGKTRYWEMDKAELETENAQTQNWNTTRLSKVGTKIRTFGIVSEQTQTIKLDKKGQPDITEDQQFDILLQKIRLNRIFKLLQSKKCV